MLRIPHCLDNRLTDGGKIAKPYAPSALYSPETLFLCFWYSFLLILFRLSLSHCARGFGKLYPAYPQLYLLTDFNISEFWYKQA
jgi:hypothetical protein